MAAHSTRAALAALFTCASVLQAGAASSFCTTAPDGRKTLGYGVKPAMVVHDGTLDITFGDASLTNETGGPANEPLFSFSRTIDAILQSSGDITPAMAPADRQAARVRFVKTMLASLKSPDDVMLNIRSGALIPVDDRSGAEGTIPAEGLLDFTDADFGLQPRALFNRFDTAPASWTNCGEYRIVYTLRPRGPEENFNERLLVIFEAAVPNPLLVPGTASAPEIGCRPIAEYWAGLPAGATDAVARATALSKLYYEGVDGVTTAPGAGTGNPIVNFRNLGGDGNKGQVRANLFFGGAWQLREWLTQRTGGGLAFIPETVKDNPTAELYRDDTTGTDLDLANIPAVLTTWHADFVAHFVGTVQDNLMVERSDKYRGLVGGLGNFDLAAGLADSATGTVDPDRLLVTLLPLGADDRFNEFQSVSQGSSDDVTILAGDKFRRTLTHLNSRRALVQGLPSEEPEVLLARAGATTCAGCHESSVGDVVKEVGENGPVKWPDVVGRFVHVSETRELSPALEQNFLPVRRYIMGTHLCSDPAPAVAAASPMMSANSTPQAPYYGDAIVAGFVPKVGPQTTMSTVTPSNFQALPRELRVLAAEAIATEVRERREVERQTPGAFVEVRRPH